MCTVTVSGLDRSIDSRRCGRILIYYVPISIKVKVIAKKSSKSHGYYLFLKLNLQITFIVGFDLFFFSIGYEDYGSGFGTRVLVKLDISPVGSFIIKLYLIKLKT